MSTHPSWKKRAAELTFKLLPARFRNHLVRQRMVFDPSLLEGVEIAVARSEEDYLAAFRTVHDAYVGRGWIAPDPSGLWVTAHHVLPESTLLMLRKQGQAVGSVALIEDSPVGLPIDHTFGEETEAMRGPHSHLVEFGSLAVSPAIRGGGLAACLMSSAWRYVKERLRATDIVVAVSAPVAAYYEALFNFLPYAPVRDYMGFGREQRALEYDPVVALRHHIPDSVQFLDSAWRRPPPPGKLNIRTLVELPFPAAFERFPPATMQRVDLVRYKLPRTVFQNLFIKETRLIEKLDAQTRSHLMTWRTEQTVKDE